MEAIASASAVRSESRNFYVWMAGGSTGTFHAEPIIHKAFKALAS
jgi:hypothetical protein